MEKESCGVSRCKYLLYIASGAAFICSLIVLVLFLQHKSTHDMSLASEEGMKQYLLDNPDVIIQSLKDHEAQLRKEQAEESDIRAREHFDSLLSQGVFYSVGPEDADVQIVEFHDFRCTYCRRAYAHVKKLVEEDTNVRLVIREFPVLGPLSVYASKVALAALKHGGEEAYRKFADNMMAADDLGAELDVRSIAENSGLDWAAIEDLVDSEEVMNILHENVVMGREKLRLTGTPAFVINGKLLRGYADYDTLKEAVAFARSEIDMDNN